MTITHCQLFCLDAASKNDCHNYENPTISGLNTVNVYFHSSHRKHTTFHIHTLCLWSANLRKKLKLKMSEQLSFTLYQAWKWTRVHSHTHTHRYTGSRDPQIAQTNCTCEGLSEWSQPCVEISHQPICLKALPCNCAFKTVGIIVVVVQKEQRMNGQIWVLWCAT